MAKKIIPADVFQQTTGFDLVLLANFVHQVINPLNGVAGTLDNLAEGIIKEEFRKEQRLRAARAQLEQCIALMRNLAFLAQGFAKLADEDRKIVVLPQVIIESAMFFQEDGKGQGIAIFLEDSKTRNRVSGHVGLIRQVLMNIFDNCIKYSEPNHSVKVVQRIQKRTSDAIIVITSRSKHPIQSSDMQHWFDLGYRGENAKKIVASGTGLGLYISKQIVEAVHGGSISVQSAGQQDVEFTIKLPGGQSAI